MIQKSRSRESADLFGADRRARPWVEHEHNRLIPHLPRQFHLVAVVIFQREVGRGVADAIALFGCVLAEAGYPDHTLFSESETWAQFTERYFKKPGANLHF